MFVFKPIMNYTKFEVGVIFPNLSLTEKKRSLSPLSYIEELSSTQSELYS